MCRQTKVAKGETLVEVIVSFALVSIVVMGVSSLTSDVMSLSLHSRYQTEAVMLAQKNLVIGKNILQASCSANNTNTYRTSTGTCDSKGYSGVVFMRCYEAVNDTANNYDSDDKKNYMPALKRSGVVTLSQLNTSTPGIVETNINLSLTTTKIVDKPIFGFYKLTSKVVWTERGDPWEYNISEIVWRSG
ncbi:MAG: prepilin-type N-terminal cleavage/methylation domain-containing protein [bacterium]